MVAITVSATEVLGVVANIASILGFVATLVVAVAVRRLRAAYIFKGRVPTIANRIAEKASTISTLAADFENTKDQISIELRQVCVMVGSLAGKSTGPTRAAAKQLVGRLTKPQLAARSDVTDVYGDIQALLAQCEEAQRDLEWDR